MSADFQFQSFNDALNYLRHISLIYGFRPHHRRNGISQRGNMSATDFIGHVQALRESGWQAHDVRAQELFAYADGLREELRNVS